MCWENIRTGETGTCTSYEEIKEFFTNRPRCIFVGHNIIKFDAPVLNRLVGVGLRVSRLVDTLTLSTLYNPSLEGGHSLGAWGERIGVPKDSFNDWTKLSEEMVAYCRQDVKLTAELFRRLIKVLRKIGFSEKTCEIQHKITHILNKQQKNGVYFDGPRALVFFQQLRKREAELQDEIRTVFPAERVLVAERPLYKKDGNHTKLYDTDRSRYVVEEDHDSGRYKAYEDVEFNIGSPKQRTEKLLALGWQADEFTPKGSPKVTEKSLVAFADEHDIPQAKMITKWMSINGRANMVNTWLDNWNEDDSCIHGKLFVADTLRFRHQAPNTANIPAVRSDKEGNVLYGEAGYFTYEARDLWCARPGRVLVGTDAAGLELRMLAHYLNRPEFTKEVVEGDPHQFNADLVGITRPTAKTLIYAALYGAGGPKVAATLKVPVREGSRIRQLFLDKLGVQDLMNECKAEQESGRVWLIDGAGVVCPSPHAALNYKLQGGGARVMAQAAVFLDQHIRRKGLDSLKVLDVHDEWQYDVLPSDADEHAALAVQSIVEAGEELNMNVPLGGESKIGKTWAQTH